MFGEAGTVTSARIIEDRETGRSRGFGFIEMSSASECATAISTFNGREMDGRTLKVNEAKEQTPRGNGGGFNSGFAGAKTGFGSTYHTPVRDPKAW